jgi:hypothetical protein
MIARINYSKLITMSTYEDRLAYLDLKSTIGVTTFGGARYLNQSFYKSQEWRIVRDFVITRDRGFDLGVLNYDIFGKVYVHHMEPVTKKSILESRELLLDPEYLITCSFTTHQAIHFGYRRNPRVESPDRRPGDTKLW